MHNCFLLQDIWSLMNNNKVSSAVHIKKIIKFARIWTKLSAYENAEAFDVDEEFDILGYTSTPEKAERLYSD